MSQPSAKVVILGGGPGGYEAALVAAQVGAEVTVVERDGLGGACVLSDCVPSAWSRPGSSWAEWWSRRGPAS